MARPTRAPPRLGRGRDPLSAASRARWLRALRAKAEDGDTASQAALLGLGAWMDLCSSMLQAADAGPAIHSPGVRR